MGQVITGLAAEDDSIEIVAGIDLHPSKDSSYPVFNSLDQCNVKADVIVDFWQKQWTDFKILFRNRHADGAVYHRSVKRAAGQGCWASASAGSRSANMSLGVNLLLKLVKDAAKVLRVLDLTLKSWKTPQQKMDAPSGTAIALADSLTRPWTCLMGIPMTEAPP